MSKTDIVEELAQQKVVEKVARRICKASPTKICDLVQLVYLALLEADEETIKRLHDNKQIEHYIARIVINQYYSVHSRYHYDIRHFTLRTTELRTDEKDNN